MIDATTLNLAWKQAEGSLNTGFFKALAPIISRFECGVWPALKALNGAAVSAQHGGSAKVQFVEANAADATATNYELFIHQTKSVPTRENWHDLFNAFAWLAFPNAKAALNAAHIRHIAAGGAEALKLRSPGRDALTLFDESGIIVLSDKRAFLEYIPAFNWRALFVEQRAQLAQHMLFLPFGHALMEKMLQPYVGMVAKVILLEVNPDFFKLNLDAQCAWCDAEVARLVAHSAIFDASV